MAMVYEEYLTALQHVESYQSVVLPELRRAYELTLDSYEDERNTWGDVLMAQRAYYMERQGVHRAPDDLAGERGADRRLPAARRPDAGAAGRRAVGGAEHAGAPASGGRRPSAVADRPAARLIGARRDRPADRAVRRNRSDALASTRPRLQGRRPRCDRDPLPAAACCAGGGRAGRSARPRAAAGRRQRQRPSPVPPPPAASPGGESEARGLLVPRPIPATAEEQRPRAAARRRRVLHAAAADPAGAALDGLGRRSPRARRPAGRR